MRLRRSSRTVRNARVTLYGKRHDTAHEQHKHMLVFRLPRVVAVERARHAEAMFARRKACYTQPAKIRLHTATTTPRTSGAHTPCYSTQRQAAACAPCTRRHRQRRQRCRAARAAAGSPAQRPAPPISTPDALFDAISPAFRLRAAISADTKYVNGGVRGREEEPSLPPESACKGMAR